MADGKRKFESEKKKEKEPEKEKIEENAIRMTHTEMNKVLFITESWMVSESSEKGTRVFFPSIVDATENLKIRERCKNFGIHVNEIRWDSTHLLLRGSSKFSMSNALDLEKVTNNCWFVPSNRDLYLRLNKGVSCPKFLVYPSHLDKRQKAGIEAKCDFRSIEPIQIQLVSPDPIRIPPPKKSFFNLSVDEPPPPPPPADEPSPSPPPSPDEPADDYDIDAYPNSKRKRDSEFDCAYL